VIVYDLTDAECEDILARASIARLGCAEGDQPYIVPISYSYDRAARAVYAFSTLGRKIVSMRWNPKVCVAVDEIVDAQHWTSVVAFGRYEEIGHTAEHGAARERAHALFEQRPGWWLPATARPADGDDRAVPVLYRIRIERISGRRTTRPG
jgi:nitroimidazol reductase NimA-like FMN-containing flavoprotein (pyridoxamine 5'-phosphate oxidase superfamily)